MFKTCFNAASLFFLNLSYCLSSALYSLQYSTVFISVASSLFTFLTPLVLLSSLSDIGPMSLIYSLLRTASIRFCFSISNGCFCFTISNVCISNSTCLFFCKASNSACLISSGITSIYCLCNFNSARMSMGIRWESSIL